MADFSSIRGLMSELLTVYQNRSDFNAIELVQSKHEKIIALCAEREATIKRILHDLQSSLMLGKERANPDAAVAKHKAQISEILKETEFVKRGIAKMEDDARQLEELRAAVNEEYSRLLEKQKKLEKMSAEEMPRTVYELSLYANISSIKWDSNESQGLKGTIVNTAKGDIWRFDFDEAASSFDVCNELWSHIG